MFTEIKACKNVRKAYKVAKNIIRYLVDVQLLKTI